MNREPTREDIEWALQADFPDGEALSILEWVAREYLASLDAPSWHGLSTETIESGKRFFDELHQPKRKKPLAGPKADEGQVTGQESDSGPIQGRK